MKTARRRSALAALTCVLALVLAGCGGDTDDPAAPPAGGDQEPTDDATDGSGDDADDGSAGGAAGGTTMRVLTVTEALDAAGEGSVHVSGLLIDDGSGWQLCELVLESYPPQCGGESLTVEGLDEADYPLEEEGDVRWQTDATVVGEVEGDTITVTGSPASS